MVSDQQALSFVERNYPEKFLLLQKYPPTSDLISYVKQTILSKITSSSLPRICSSTIDENEKLSQPNNFSQGDQNENEKFSQLNNFSQGDQNENLTKPFSNANISIPFNRTKPKFYDLPSNNATIQNSLLTKYKQVYSFMEQCVANGNSSSLLLIGPHHSGKTLVVNNCVSELNERFNKSKGMPAFLLIHLDGILQIDDKHAVREIARQLDLKLYNISRNRGNENLLQDIYNEDDSDDEFDVPKSNSDSAFEKRSISETFSLILKSLEEINFKHDEDKSISLIFVIDNFEVYTDNNKQTLLYNLFDMSSNNYTVPISVIGNTTRVNVKELLEKRVSSRFSQRVINFFGSVNSNHKDYLVNYHVYSELEYFWFDLRYNLCLTRHEILQIKDKELQYFGYLWNDLINDLFYEKSIAQDFKIKLLENFITVKDMKIFLTNSCIYPICKISQTSPFLIDCNFATLDDMNNFSFGIRNPKHDKLYNLINHTLTDLQLLMLICACRVIMKLEINFINFNLSFEEYSKIMQKIVPSTVGSSGENVFLENGKLKKRLAGNAGSTGLTRRYTKMTCKNSWEFLVMFSIFVPAGDTGLNAASGGNSFSGGNYQCNLDLADLNNSLEKTHKFRRLTTL